MNYQNTTTGELAASIRVTLGGITPKQKLAIAA
jgi:hypothetical protein